MSPSIPLSVYAQESILILGGGESGIGAALLARRQGANVFLSEYGQLRPEAINTLQQEGIRFEQGGHTDRCFEKTTLVVKSPGISDQVPIVRKIKQEKLPIISEIELAARVYKGKVIAITGTNGKTTTTSLVAHLLRCGGFEVEVAGNIGASWARLLSEGRNPAWYVLEVSSFQLDHIEQFAPHIALLLNIAPDHLDRYENNFQDYAASKFRITKNQTEQDIFLFWEDNTIRKWIGFACRKPCYLPFSEKGDTPANLVDGKVNFCSPPFSSAFSLPLKKFSAFRGRHNQLNALAAVSVANMAGMEEQDFPQALQSFKLPAHRMEEVAEVGGISYINDSKATNVDAVRYALDSFDKPLVWIAGGEDKGNDYTELIPLVQQRVKHLVCLGKENQTLLRTFGGIVPCSDTHSMQEAIKTAASMAETGDIVLLSPACASFDLFKNYEDRGEQFKEGVFLLGKTQSRASE